MNNFKRGSPTYIFVIMIRWFQTTIKSILTWKNKIKININIADTLVRKKVILQNLSKPNHSNRDEFKVRIFNMAV